jgi:hypothetical protein
LRKIDETIESGDKETYYKPITYAYKDMDLEEFEKIKHENGDFEKEEHREVLESDLTFVSTFFL